MTNKKAKNNKKLYFLIESTKLFKKPQDNVTGKIIEVVISDEVPCILMRKNKVIVLGGQLYELKIKNKDPFYVPEFDNIQKALSKLRKLR